MNNFAFPNPQDALAQMQAAGQKALDASQKFFGAHLALVQENTLSAFGLARSAMEVRDVEGFKSFATDAARVSREAFERSTQFVQDLASQQVAAAQDLGKTASRKR